MNCFQQSLILSLIARFWNAVTDCYKQSMLGRGVDALVCLFRRGLVWFLLSFQSGLEERLRGSLFYRLVTWCFSIVPELFGRLYTHFSTIAERSIFCHALRFMGSRVMCFVGIMLFFLLIVPYERWNNMYSLIFAVFLLCLFWLSGVFDREKRVDIAHLGPWPVLFAAASCLSLLWSQDMSLSVKFLFFNLTCILIVVVMVSAVEKERQLLRVIEFCAAGLLIAGLFAVWQRMTGIEASSSFTDLDVNKNMPGRVYSFFKNPNAYANILVFFTPMMLSMVFFAPNWRRKLLFAAATGLCCLVLLMTYSRGGWLAMAFAVVVLMLMLCPRWVPLLVIVGVFALPFLPDNIKSRLLTIFTSDSSISSRNYIYSAMVRLIEGNWLFGVGLGATALKRGVLYYGVYKADFPFVHAHNIVLEIWGESGIFAMLSFVLAMFVSFRKAIAAKKRAGTPLLRGILAGGVAGLAGSMLFGLTDYAWVFPRVMVLFWFLFAMVYCAIKLSKAEVK